MAGKNSFNFMTLVLGSTLSLGLTLFSLYWFGFFTLKGPIQPAIKADRENIIASGQLGKPNIQTADEDQPEERDQDDKEGRADDDDEPDDTEEDLVALKEQYDDVIRLARKLTAGNVYLKAAAKYKEAIKLAEKVPSAAKDLISLYNNSSAMYEKAGVFEEALLDINIVLIMDWTHSKARMRRARILEAQGKLEQALEEQVFVMLREQVDGHPEAQSHAPGIDRLAKVVAAKTTSKAIRKMKSNELELPPAPKSFCKSFFESFPAFYRWNALYADTDRESLANSSTIDTVAVHTQLARTLILISFDLHKKHYKRAFDLLLDPSTELLTKRVKQELEGSTSGEALEPSETEVVLDLDSAPNTLLAAYYDLCGTYNQISCQLGKAQECYEAALALYPSSLDSRLKLALLYAESGEASKAEQLYSTWLQPSTVTSGSSLAVPESVSVAVAEAWTLLHRAGMWTVRDDDGKFRADAIPTAITDIDRVRFITEAWLARSTGHRTDAGQGDVEVATVTPVQREELQGALYVGLHKAQYIISHTAGQMGYNVTEEQQEYVKDCAVRAQQLYPSEEASTLQEVDALLSDGQLEQALSRIDAAQQVAQKTEDTSLEASIVTMRANVYSQQAFSHLIDPQSPDRTKFNELMGKAGEQFESAMKLEPYGTDAVAAYAQLKCLTGEFTAAAELVEKALTLVRTRDDALDIRQLYAMAKAQSKALAEIQKNRT